jgi:hypothetical protein
MRARDRSPLNIAPKHWPGRAPFDQELLDYVIVHEFLHFYVPNHGKLWKSLMQAYLGDYERAEARLRTKAMLSGQHR